jgi:TRAP-type C4-dicarboxylate transport system substrate-binding protein
MKRNLFSFILVTSIFLIIVFINQGFAQELPEVKWDLPHFCSPTYFMARDFEQFAKDVKAKTNGKFNIVLHSGSSLVTGPETAPAVVSGRVPIGPILSAYVYDLFPELSVTMLPFSTSAYQELRSMAEQLRSYFYQVLEKKNVKPLFMYAWPTQQVFSKTPMDTIAAWKGKKVRIMNSEQADLCKRVQAVPINIAFSELYTALQRGTVDAFTTSSTNIPVMKFYEVCKYADLWTIGGGGLEFLCVNIRAWNKLPREYQDALLKVIEETKIENKLWADGAKVDETSIDEVKNKGMVILYPSKSEIEKMRKIARVIWDKWARDHGTEDLLEKAIKAAGH